MLFRPILLLAGAGALLTYGLDRSAPPAAGTLAVVELFTSEGCSSCPPADRALADLSTDPNVISLSFHVDYWDRLGWRDPFSDARWSERQRAYDQALREETYTPQCVVNGRTAFVGSEVDRLHREVKGAPSDAGPITVDGTARRSAAAVSVDWKAAGIPSGAALQAFLVLKEATSQVRRGENNGRTLHHVNVVRAMATATLDQGASSGALSLPVPAGDPASEYHVVLLVQQGQAGRVFAAASLKVS